MKKIAKIVFLSVIFCISAWAEKASVQNQKKDCVSEIKSAYYISTEITPRIQACLLEKPKYNAVIEKLCMQEEGSSRLIPSKMFETYLSFDRQSNELGQKMVAQVDGSKKREYINALNRLDEKWITLGSKDLVNQLLADFHGFIENCD